MRSYFIDELRRNELEKFERSLKDRGFKNPITDIFWIEVPNELLTEIQKEHLTTCGPYIFSVELGKNWIKVELLIRPTGKIRCECISYATTEQRNYVIDLIDNLLNANDKTIKA